jgi:hypothetical protein
MSSKQAEPPNTALQWYGGMWLGWTFMWLSARFGEPA